MFQAILCRSSKENRLRKGRQIRSPLSPFQLNLLLSALSFRSLTTLYFAMIVAFLSGALALQVPMTKTSPRRRVGVVVDGTTGGAEPRSQLQQLSSMTTLSIDSGDLDVIAEWAKTGTITDATTNPLFVAQAGTSGDPRYVAFVEKAITYGKKYGDDDVVALAMDRLAVELGMEIVKLVPGFVSTEVDIRASFDVEETLRRARRIIAMYEAEGVHRSRILIKVAGTAEGIEAARILELEGITCNITLIFGFCQAVYAAQAGARLISPFPGRIKDWHTANGGSSTYEPHEDPGVVEVKKMFRYYNAHGHETICMPASWRPSRGTSDPDFALDEIRALSGVDRMTIPPALLSQLDAASLDLPQILEFDGIDDMPDPLGGEDGLTPAAFRLLLNQDLCATTKLAEGINAFIKETLKLEAAILDKL